MSEVIVSRSKQYLENVNERQNAGLQVFINVFNPFFSAYSRVLKGFITERSLPIRVKQPLAGFVDSIQDPGEGLDWPLSQHLVIYRSTYTFFKKKTVAFLNISGLHPSTNSPEISFYPHFLFFRKELWQSVPEVFLEESHNLSLILYSISTWATGFRKMAILFQINFGSGVFVSSIDKSLELSKGLLERLQEKFGVAINDYFQAWSCSIEAVIEAQKQDYTNLKYHLVEELDARCNALLAALSWLDFKETNNEQDPYLAVCQKVIWS